MKSRFRRKNFLCLANCLIIVLLIVLSSCAPSGKEVSKHSKPRETTAPLEVYFLNVGQGDCQYISFIDDKDMLIDAGDTTAGKKVVSFLKEKGVKQIDFVVLTHPHADHLAGLLDVANNFEIGEVIESGYESRTATYGKFKALIAEKGVKKRKVRRKDKIDLHEKLDVKVLNPGEELYNDPNNNSVVIQLKYNKVKFLFTGDAEKEAESEIVNAYGDNLKSQILKVGHHGSRTASSQEFLKLVKPEVAIIQVGKNNRYGHPHKETLHKYEALGTRIYRTDLQGTITVTTNGEFYSVTTSTHPIAR